MQITVTFDEKRSIQNLLLYFKKHSSRVFKISKIFVNRTHSASRTLQNLRPYKRAYPHPTLNEKIGAFTHKRLVAHLSHVCLLSTSQENVSIKLFYSKLTFKVDKDVYKKTQFPKNLTQVSKSAPLAPAPLGVYESGLTRLKNWAKNSKTFIKTSDLRKSKY